MHRLTCRTCQTPFTATHRRAYCQPSCRSSAWKPLRIVAVTCEGCKKVFMPTKITHGGMQRFCSAKCCNVAYKAKRKALNAAQPRKPRVPRTKADPVVYSKVARECKQCLAPFEVFSYEIRKFCTARCAKTHSNKLRGRGKIHADLADSCEICGWDRRVDSAHILPARNGWKLERWNTLRLCPNHHTAYDNGRLTLDELDKLGIGFLAA